MIAPDVDNAIARLQELVHAAGTIVPFTGAGISTECGIPDFRSPGGLWTKNRPIPFDEFISSQDARNESWRRRFAMEERFAGARPGRGHCAIASLYRAGKVPAVVTQNIDNLHQVSGIPAEDVVELHGNTTYAHCLDCDERFDLQWVRRHMDAGNGCAPDCPSCGGYIKTATISFGQAMPEAAVRRAGSRASLRAHDFDRLVACGVARGRTSAVGEAKRRYARHHQSRSDRFRRCRGPRCARGYRNSTRTFRCRALDRVTRLVHRP